MTEKHAQDIKTELRRFIINNYLRGAKDFKLSDGDSFLENSILDSIGVIEVTAFIQQRYGIKIKVNEIMPENFDTINNLEQYITKKLKEERS